MKNKYVFVVIMLCCILFVSVGVTNIYVNANSTEEKTEDFVIVTSFYPMYIATMNVVEDVSGVSLKNLSRETLANSDEKAEIIEVGFLQALAALIESPADDISPLTGEELVKEKVKRIWSMAGRWDIDGGFEYNFANNMRARMGAYTVLEKCPVPITFLGWEVGADVITGGKLDNSDHLYNVLLDYKHPNGRMSWDPMLTLLAITNDNEKAGYATVYGKGSIEIESGKNHFEKDEKGIHSFVVKTKENEYYENEINRIILNGF